eukprot:TRINITY_DN5982_c0_g1_i2.p1 TRINITY_DN5982_c0_g1~~TRINITY_DN5982_c0_g1_i2.p1  ORF type:complete len:728 (-),score=114.77 TRINITY_DN5982_c0_g1_i2:371-2533(-)
MAQQKIDSFFKSTVQKGADEKNDKVQEKSSLKRARETPTKTSVSQFQDLFSPSRKRVCAQVNPEESLRKLSFSTQTQDTRNETNKSGNSALQDSQKETMEQQSCLLYSALVEMFEKVENETKRLVITDYCVQMFKKVIKQHSEDLLPTIYLCVNRVAPEHVGIELGVGDAILIRTLADSTGKKATDVKKEMQKSGDLGNVAAKARSSQRTLMNVKTKDLTLREVYETFLKIAKEEGGKSQEQKRRHISRLLVSAKGREAAYIIRSLQGRLRIGLAEQTVLTALATAVTQTQTSENLRTVSVEDAVRIVKQVYSECPSYDELIPALLQGGIDDLEKRCGFVVGVPVKPMLAKPTNTITEVLDKFSGSEFTCEYKYDGERAQIHILESGEVKIFSRNSENTTEKYPDIVERMPKLLQEGVNTAVFDCEAVAYDVEKDQMLPFQVLSTRARKDVKIKDLKVQVCVFAFDCLYLNGKVLLGEALTVRREALYSALKEEKKELRFATARTSKDVEELQSFLNEAINEGTEGLIVKTMDATYEPSKRSLNWLKLKKDYMDGVGDSIDVAVIGAWHGRGKRAGLYGSYLLAIYDPDTERFQSITKIGTGFSDELLKTLSEKLQTNLVDSKRSYYDVGENSQPDVWFDGKTVWEIKGADFSISPLYRAAVGWVDDSKGISVRFPRWIRERDDKTSEQTTSPQEISEMYKSQTIVQKSGKMQDQDQENE